MTVLHQLIMLLEGTRSNQMGQKRAKWRVLELAALQVQVMSSFVHFPFVFAFFIFSLSHYIFPSL